MLWAKNIEHKAGPRRLGLLPHAATNPEQDAGGGLSDFRPQFPFKEYKVCIIIFSCSFLLNIVFELAKI